MARILILDDDYLLARLWKDKLEQRGHDCAVSLSSSEAIAQAEHSDWDIYIVDLMLPVSLPNMRDSGQNFLTYLAKQHGATYLTNRVLGVSGVLSVNMPSMPRDLFQYYGVRQILPKPFALGQLVETIDAMLRADG